MSESVSELSAAIAGSHANSIHRLTSTNRSEKDEDHCVSCDELMAKARRKSGANAHMPPSSAKIRKILELLHDTEERGEGEKTIVFSQFTSMLDLVEPFLKAGGIKYVRCKC